MDITNSVLTAQNGAILPPSAALSATAFPMNHMPTNNFTSAWREGDSLEYDCHKCRQRKEQEQHRRLQMPSAPESHDPFLGYLPEDGESKQPHWSKSHLLSLPKELRHRIFELVLTDTSQPASLVNIDRKPSSPFLRHNSHREPKLRFSHTRRQCSFSISLLLTSRSLYEEALPILYAPVTFVPKHLEGLLSVFLDTLSPYAKSCVRTIRLEIPEDVTQRGFQHDRSKPFFHWAVTCAQVAKLNDTLAQLEIESDWSVFDNIANRRRLLFPLCKIKATKKFAQCSRYDNGPINYDEAFEVLLTEAEEALRAKAQVRKDQTQAEAIERAARDKKCAKNERKEENTHNFQSNALRDRDWAFPDIFDPEEYMQRVEKDLVLIPGIKQFEKELEEHTRKCAAEETALEPDTMILDDWDLLSLGSGASTPRVQPSSPSSKHVGAAEVWPDTASTIVGMDDDDSKDYVKDPGSDTGDEDWEVVDP